MKKYVVLGVNENPKYLYYLPLVCWAWKKLGWDCIVFCVGGVSVDHFTNLVKTFVHIEVEIITHEIKPINGYKTATLAQVSRLYAVCVDTFSGSDYLMTSDVDMLPLSNYWLPVENRPATWGRDLTDYHYPICYIGMTSYHWMNVMGIWKQDYNQMIEQDLKTYIPKAKNVWCLDQDVVTDKILKYGKEKVTHINRGTDPRTGYPIGRVDRSNWRLDHKVLIDAHLPHDVLTNEDSFRKVMELLHHVWPKEDFKWFVQYTKEFKKLL